MEERDRLVEYGLSAFYGNAYLLQAAHHVWHASVSAKRTFPLPEHELNATLFAAFAVEAFINTALDLMLGREEAKGLERISVADRWSFGARLMFGTPLFPKGEEPDTTLRALIRERNRLVHARSIRFGWRSFPGEEERTHQDLETVARYLLRVSQAVDELGRQAPELAPLRLVPSGLLKLDAQLARYDAARHSDQLRAAIRRLRVQLAEEEFGTLQEWVEDYGEDPADVYWTNESEIEEHLPDP